MPHLASSSSLFAILASALSASALRATPRVPVASPRAPAPRTTSLLLRAAKELDTDSFCEMIDKVPRMAVVEFYAPWCRTCKAVEPTFERVAAKYKDEVDFFKVDFKANKRLALAERVWALPTVHFYVPNFGRVNRFTLSPSNAAPRMNGRTAR